MKELLHKISASARKQRAVKDEPDGTALAQLRERKAGLPFDSCGSRCWSQAHNHPETHTSTAGVRLDAVRRILTGLIDATLQLAARLTLPTLAGDFASRCQLCLHHLRTFGRRNAEKCVRVRIRKHVASHTSISN